MTTKDAVRQLVNAMKKDKNFKNSYVATIAMCAYDELRESGMKSKQAITVSNNIAKNYIKLFISEM